MFYHRKRFYATILDLFTIFRTALRKMTNIRRFSESSNGNLDDLVKLLQSLFLKPYTSNFVVFFYRDEHLFLAQMNSTIILNF